MPIDKKLLQQFVSTNKYDICKDTPDVALALSQVLAETDSLVGTRQNREAVPFVLWNDFLNVKGTLAPKSTRNYIRYTWGDKVFVDFGCTNVQTEISYPHPAIILYNFASTVVVAPTTSDDSPHDLSPDVEAVIVKVRGDGSIFPRDSIINLHQIKAIHKDRIIKDLRTNISNYVVDDDEIQRLNSIEEKSVFSKDMNLRNCIHTKLAMIFASNQLHSYLQKIDAQNAQIDELNKSIGYKNIEIARLLTELEKKVSNK